MLFALINGLGKSARLTGLAEETKASKVSLLVSETGSRRLR
jgi:hypothetical protein